MMNHVTFGQLYGLGIITNLADELKVISRMANGPTVSYDITDHEVLESLRDREVCFIYPRMYAPKHGGEPYATLMVELA